MTDIKRILNNQVLKREIFNHVYLINRLQVDGEVRKRNGALYQPTCMRWIDLIQDAIVLTRYGYLDELIALLHQQEEKYKKYKWFQIDGETEECGASGFTFVPNLKNIIKEACIWDHINIIKYLYSRYGHLNEVYYYIEHYCSTTFKFDHSSIKEMINSQQIKPKQHIGNSKNDKLDQLIIQKIQYKKSKLVPCVDVANTNTDTNMDDDEDYDVEDDDRDDIDNIEDKPYTIEELKKMDIIAPLLQSPHLRKDIFETITQLYQESRDDNERLTKFQNYCIKNYTELTKVSSLMDDDGYVTNIFAFLWEKDPSDQQHKQQISNTLLLNLFKTNGCIRIVKYLLNNIDTFNLRVLLEAASVACQYGFLELFVEIYEYITNNNYPMLMREVEELLSRSLVRRHIKIAKYLIDQVGVLSINTNLQLLIDYQQLPSLIFYLQIINKDDNYNQPLPVSFLDEIFKISYQYILGRGLTDSLIEMIRYLVDNNYNYPKAAEIFKIPQKKLYSMISKMDTPLSKPGMLVDFIKYLESNNLLDTQSQWFSLLEGHLQSQVKGDLDVVLYLYDQGHATWKDPLNLKFNMDINRFLSFNLLE